MPIMANNFTFKICHYYENNTTTTSAFLDKTVKEVILCKICILCICLALGFMLPVICPVGRRSLCSSSEESVPVPSGKP